MAGKYQRGRQWYLSWVEDGRQIRRSLGTVTEAEAEAARLAHEARVGFVAAAGPNFGDWASRYATWHSQEYPDSYYRVEQILRCHLIPCFGTTPLMALTRIQYDLRRPPPRVRAKADAGRPEARNRHPATAA